MPKQGAGPDNVQAQTQVHTEASWTAMSQALDELRSAFAKAIEITAKTFTEAAKGLDPVG